MYIRTQTKILVLLKSRRRKHYSRCKKLAFKYGGEFDSAFHNKAQTVRKMRGPIQIHMYIHITID